MFNLKISRTIHRDETVRAFAAPVEKRPRRRTNPVQQGISLLLAGTMLWTYGVSPTAAAASDAIHRHRADMQKQAIAAAKMKQHIREALAPHKGVKMMPQSPRVVPAVKTAIAPVHTLLDAGGRLIRDVAPQEISSWKSQLADTKTSRQTRAQLHIWLGEWKLDGQKDPDAARQEFWTARALSQKGQSTFGLAEYDTAISDFRTGAYQQANNEFHQLVLSSRTMTGYDLQECALWNRHAQACAGYHNAHSKLGIPEPPKLDPLCGAAAIATSLKALHLASDKKTVLASCRVTGFGSTFRDIVNAGPGLHVNIRPVTATEEGLRALPKPVVAYIERDHFVSVVKADSTGVSYLCSDCGAWPGGRVNLTWRQWRTLNPGIYATVTRPGTQWDGVMSAKADVDQHGGVQLAMADLGAKVLPYMPALHNLKGVQFRWFGLDDITCGYSGYFGGECADCLVCCLLDALGLGSSDSSGGLGLSPNAKGPSAGDPVNLATGGEEYTPEPDLVVYNPHGPSVTWQRFYNSLRSFAERDSAHQASWSYEYSDFGNAWSNQYNISVVKGTSTDYLILPNGARIAFTGTQPTSAAPTTNCTVQAGAPLLIQWKYATTGTYFTVTWEDRTVWTTTTASSNWQLAQITDRNGHSIYFNYGATQVSGYYLLNTITDQASGAGTKLLTMARDTNNHLVSVTDCYGRSVYYHVQQGGEPQSPTLDFVSQIVPTCNSSVPVRYQYGYVNIVNSEGVHGAPYLHTISVPSPTGTGMSTATINYTTNTPYVSSLVDANGNKRAYTQTDQLDTKVTVTNSSNATVYSYTGAFDNNMSGLSVTDGSGLLKAINVFSDPNNPYRPSATMDAIAARAALTSGSLYPGETGTVLGPGSDPPAGGAAFWEIDSPSGAILGTYYSPNGWNVTTNGNGTTYSFLVQVPPTAAAGTNYEVRWNYQDGHHSGFFNVISVANGSGVTTRTWDQYGHILTETSPRGTVTTNTYSYTNFALGELTQVQEGTKSPTKYFYNEPSGLINTMESPVPGTVGSSSYATYTITYNTYGDATQVTEPGNNATTSNITTFSYGSTPAVHQPLSVTNNLGYTTQLTYDSQGNTTSVTDASSIETDLGDATRQNGYNIANQPVLVTFPTTNTVPGGHAAKIMTYLYPGGPQLATKVYDEGGNQVRESDVAYGQEGETLANTGSTEPAAYVYDSQYRIKTLTDGNGHTTHYAYNTAGYLSTASYPGSGGATTGSDTVNYSSYDADGNPLTRVDGNGTTATYTYNDAERKLTKIHYSTIPTGVASLYDVNLAYDSYGRLSTVNNGVTATNYGYTSGTAYPGYDDNNQPLNIQTVYYGADGTTQLFAKAVGYSYYNDGSRSAMSTPAGNFTYNYDAGGRLTSLVNPSSETSSWTYSNNNWLNTQTLGNGAYTTYTYNARGFLTDLNNANSSASTLSDFSSPSYDAVGNRLQLVANFGTTAPTSYSGTVNYTYDYAQTANPALNRDQLTQETSTARNGGYTNNFGYDGNVSTGAGNPTTFRSQGTNTFNANNQITSFYGPTGTSLGSFAYDGNGNPTTYKSSTLTFDPENRLTAYGSGFAAGYTPGNLRAWKSAGGSTAQTFFLYDGETPICELDSSGNVTATNTFGLNGLLSRTVGTASTFYTFDPQGNTAQRLNSSQSVLGSYLFDAFGNRVSTDSSSDPYSGFGAEMGYYQDSETGLSLLTYRYYDSGTGRFVTRDPIEYDGGINIYAYALNNAINRIDPAGCGSTIQNIACAIAILKAGISCAQAYVQKSIWNGLKCAADAAAALAACAAACGFGGPKGPGPGHGPGPGGPGHGPGNGPGPCHTGPGGGTTTTTTTTSGGGGTTTTTTTTSGGGGTTTTTTTSHY